MTTTDGEVWRRRWWALGMAAALAAFLPLVIGHRGTHIALNLLLPGAGLFGVDTLAAVALVAAAVAAVVAWMRWGMDWTLVAVLLAAMVVSGLSVHDHAAAAAPVLSAHPAAHEFPLVLIVVSALSRAERAARRFPPIAALHRRRAAKRDGWAALAALTPVDRCRAVSFTALAGVVDETCVAAPRRADVARRARRVGAAARARFTGDPLRVDHVHARTALALTGDADVGRQLATDASATAIGVPCSEPGWVRLLDASLAAATLARLGRNEAVADLRRLLSEELRLKRGHRPAAWWTILGIRTGAAAQWEHVVATGVARALEAVGDDEWLALRRRALGAAARGTADAHDERVIAGARLWLAYVDDDQAAPIIARPTVRHDPLAIAVDHLARRLAAAPDLLRPPSAVAGAR